MKIVDLEMESRELKIVRVGNKKRRHFDMHWRESSECWEQDGGDIGTD